MMNKCALFLLFALYCSNLSAESSQEEAGVFSLQHCQNLWDKMEGDIWFTNALEGFDENERISAYSQVYQEPIEILTFYRFNGLSIPMQSVGIAADYNSIVTASAVPYCDEQGHFWISYHYQMDQETIPYTASIEKVRQNEKGQITEIVQTIDVDRSAFIYYGLQLLQDMNFEGFFIPEVTLSSCEELGDKVERVKHYFHDIPFLEQHEISKSWGDNFSENAVQVHHYYSPDQGIYLREEILFHAGALFGNLFCDEAHEEIHLVNNQGVFVIQDIQLGANDQINKMDVLIHYEEMSAPLILLEVLKNTLYAEK